MYCVFSPTQTSSDLLTNKKVQLVQCSYLTKYLTSSETFYNLFGDLRSLLFIASCLFKYVLNSLIHRAPKFSKLMRFSSRNHIQNTDILSVYSVSTLLYMLSDWAIAEMLFELEMQMLMVKANIAHLTVQTLNFVHNSASKELLIRLFKGGHHSFTLFDEKTALYFNC